MEGTRRNPACTVPGQRERILRRPCSVRYCQSTCCTGKIYTGSDFCHEHSLMLMNSHGWTHSLRQRKGKMHRNRSNLKRNMKVQQQLQLLNKSKLMQYSCYPVKYIAAKSQDSDVVYANEYCFFPSS